ncbi:MAG: O-acetyl-ADP-ribose deacetylase, partial [Acidimicrobiia bacterium]
MSTRLEAIQADITTIEVDAIVNAANSSLMGGGGVDGAIHRAGGPAILAACREIVAKQGGLATGEAVITTAGDLPARHVIHTVGPIWGTVSEDEAVTLLASCYRNSLDLARSAKCRTVAFPNISTGVYRFPKELAARTAVAEVES